MSDNQFGVTLNFGNGVEREYTISGKIADALFSGEHVVVEVCHPDHGEVFRAKSVDPNYVL